MTEKFSLPVYRDISKRYGIVFSYSYFRPILVNWETLEITILQLASRTRAHYGVARAEDAEAFLTGHMLCVRSPRDCHYVIDTRNISSNEKHAEVDSSKFDALKFMSEEIKKRTAPAEAAAYQPVNMLERALNACLNDKSRDFTITSNDSGSFPVHSVLLSKLWPFFETATSINMKEKDTQTLHLPYSKTSVKTLVDFFYGVDPHNMSYNTSIALLSMSSVYDIPELRQTVSSYILAHPPAMDFSTALKAWKTAHEADYTDLQPMFASFLKEHAAKIQDSEEASGLSESELLELLCQIVK